MACVRRAVCRCAPRLAPGWGRWGTAGPVLTVGDLQIQTDSHCNTSAHILTKVGRNLHLMPGHPLHTLKTQMEQAFPGFEAVDRLSPVVSTRQNFDTLLIPEDHQARSPKDTYYLNRATVLRTHTSAHQHDLLRRGLRQFLVCGDVYRRDEIDRTHYWVFHQMEGVKVMADATPAEVEADLKQSLERLVLQLFGALQPNDMRWVDAYFPFTEPSFELEIKWQGQWLETLGCGIMQPAILQGAGLPASHRGWAFGIGLERIAMLLFKIPDIRLFWSTNKRFLSQFADGAVREFRPLVSLKDYPPNNQSISFWVPPDFADNDFYDLVRSMTFEDLVEEVQLFDSFTHPKTGRQSKAFHIIFRSPEKTLSTDEVNGHMAVLRDAVVQRLGVTLR